jgi:hypothetical protein
MLHTTSDKEMVKKLVHYVEIKFHLNEYIE